jgi:hypothetical protein
MPHGDTGGPDTVGQDVSHGDVRCDECGTVVLESVERENSDEINKEIEKHFRDTGHSSYSFYGRTKMEA